MSYSIIKNFPADQMLRIIKSNTTIQGMLKDFINSDVKHFQIAEDMKQNWKDTSGVGLQSCNPKNRKELDNYIKKVNRRLNTITRNPVKLIVVPIGLNNMCHLNCERIARFLNRVYDTSKFKCVKGYNIFTCPCGKMVNTELHSVIKYEDEYMDITNDYDDVKEKTFLECDVLTKKFQSINENGDIRNIDFWVNVKKYHLCPAIKGFPKFTTNDICRKIEMFDSVFDAINLEELDEKETQHNSNETIMKDSCYIERFMGEVNDCCNCKEEYEVSKSQNDLQLEGGIGYCSQECADEYYEKENMIEEEEETCDMCDRPPTHMCLKGISIPPYTEKGQVCDIHMEEMKSNSKKVIHINEN